MENFNRKINDQPISSHKKAVPGKLKAKFALFNPLKPSQSPLRKMKKYSNEPDSESQTLFLAYNMLHYNNLKLLNNEVIKSRARILVKRFPPTRRGRLARCRKSMRPDADGNLNIAEKSKKGSTKERKQLNDVKTNDFKVGALVQLLSKSVRQGRSRYLGEQWLGPYIFLENISEGTCKIKLGRTTKIVNSFELKSYFDKRLV